MKLYHYWRSSSSWRVRWALAYKHIPCDWVAINLLTDESDSEAHLRRNPMGYVPALELEGKNGPVYLTESIAIIEWLEETHPEPRLLPVDPFERAQVRQLAEVINSGTQPLQNLTTMLLHSDNPEEQKRWARHWSRKGLQAYEKLAQETAGTFSFGNSLTLADLFLAPQCYNALRQEISLDEFPLIKKIYEAALATPSGQTSHPDRFAP
jgi:maleylacetoacetate isomerase